MPPFGRRRSESSYIGGSSPTHIRAILFALNKQSSIELLSQSEHHNQLFGKCLIGKLFFTVSFALFLRMM